MKQMINKAFPLQWPVGWKRSKETEHSRFSRKNISGWRREITISEAVKQLEKEIRLLGGKDLVISSNLRLRKDGLPISNQRKPDDVGVAVYFVWKDNQRVMAGDKYKRCACNIYAIALTIEAMRKIERYATSEILQRTFTGFNALPEKAGEGKGAWYQVLNVNADCTQEELKLAFREMAKKNHPDVSDDEGYWYVIESAYREGNMQFEKS